MRKFLTIAIIALSINAFAQNSKETQVATKNLTIIGTIKNFEEFAAFIVLDTTNIQLVSVPADGRLGVTYTHQGRLSFNSNLPKLPVPKKAAFRYNIPNIPLGKYYIVAQELKNKGMNSNGHVSGQNPFFVTDDNKKFIIVVSDDSNSPLTIDVGTLLVWLN